jgi:hypothetical protein
MEAVLDDIKVMYVESTNGPEGGPDAFNKLESRLPSLKGRKFYGTFQYPDGPYRACIALGDSDDSKALGLDTWVIPGGKYARRKLEDWAKRAWEIPQLFTALSEEYRGRVDSSRPSIEFYKSQKELLVFLPLK